MNEIIEYRTAFSEDSRDLDKAVNDLIKAGFKLYGNPYTSERFRFQAMVKYAPKPEPQVRVIGAALGN